MNRGQCMEHLLALGVSSPEQASRDIDTDAVVGVVRWAQDENRKGRPPASGIIVHKLRQGGLAGYGTAKEATHRWWQTNYGRQHWIEGNVGDLDPQWAEVAIISLTQQKVEPTEPLVREWAVVCEKQQAEHDEVCREAVRIQNGVREPKVEEKLAA